MAVYLIGYDLNKSGKDYAGVFKAIKDSSTGEWWHHLDSTWIIKSSLTVNEVSDNIKAETDNDDRFIVIEIKNNKQGWLEQNAWDYLNQSIFT